MSNFNSSSDGIGVLGLLGVAFIVLKLTHVITWSWWWVTAPFWGGLALALAIAIVAGIFLAVARSFESKEERAARKLRESLGRLSRALDKR
jgi:phosphoglycerol transferase MdoB-like AlkP superfamily enzyme